MTEGCARGRELSVFHMGRIGVGPKARPPLFFVSVESKGFRDCVSRLFAILAGRFVSVAAKGLTRAECWRESNWVGREDFEGVRRTAGWASMGGGRGRAVPNT